MAPVRKTRSRERSWWPIPFVLLLLVILGWVLVRHSGSWLVRKDSLEHVRHMLVLDGQGADLERTSAAAGLMADGTVDTIWVSGGRIFRDQNAGDFYIRDMLRQGDGKIDPSRIFLVEQDDHSTIEEARTFIPILRSRGIDSVVLVTGTATTRRATLIFNRLAEGHPVFLAYDPTDPFFSESGWMNTRQGRKIWFREWLALAWANLELLWTPTVQDVPGKKYPMKAWGKQELTVEHRAGEWAFPSSSSSSAQVDSTSDSVALQSMDESSSSATKPSSSAKKLSSSSGKSSAAQKSSAKSSSSSRGKASSGKGK